MEVSAILKPLCEAQGISGYENGLCEIFEKIADPYLGERSSDALGSRWYEKNANGRKRLMIEAHGDKIGLMLSHITEGGFLKFAQVGGFDKKIMPASRVIVHGRRELYGVIGSVPPHLRKKQSFSEDNLAIDIGFGREKASELTDVGDLIEFETEYTPLAGTRAAASAFDDRAGIASIIKCLELLGEDGCSVIPCVSTQEEVGCRGAKTAAYNINPDMYICIDVEHGTTPDAAHDTYPLGKGPVITIGPNVQPFMSKRLIEVAKKNEIPYQLEVCGGNTGTNAWTVQIAKRGIPTALISIPLRYMHTCYEVIDLVDVENTARLLAEFAKSMA